MIEIVDGSEVDEQKIQDFGCGFLIILFAKFSAGSAEKCYGCNSFFEKQGEKIIFRGGCKAKVKSVPTGN